MWLVGHTVCCLRECGWYVVCVVWGRASGLYCVKVHKYMEFIVFLSDRKFCVNLVEDDNLRFNTTWGMSPWILLHYFVCNWIVTEGSSEDNSTFRLFLGYSSNPWGASSELPTSVGFHQDTDKTKSSRKLVNLTTPNYDNYNVFTVKIKITKIHFLYILFSYAKVGGRRGVVIIYI